MRRCIIPRFRWNAAVHSDCGIEPVGLLLGERATVVMQQGTLPMLRGIGRRLRESRNSRRLSRRAVPDPTTPIPLRATPFERLQMTPFSI
jgi:hypothetical protein